MLLYSSNLKQPKGNENPSQLLGAIETETQSVADSIGVDPPTKMREEIMPLLYKCRPKRKIASELFISESTVREYSRRHYKKPGIHGKEELVDLVESYSGDSVAR